MKNLYNNYVDPTDNENLIYWSKKWHASTRQIKDAILHTGTLDPLTIKNWIRKDDLLYHPLEGAKILVKKTLDVIF